MDCKPSWISMFCSLELETPCRAGVLSWRALLLQKVTNHSLDDLLVVCSIVGEG